MASMQTRLAQDAARDAEVKWKRHAAHCVSYGQVVRRQRHAQLCGGGAELHNEMTRLKMAARHEAALDKQIPEEQEALF